ncbi:MAG: hypothetical protein PHF74_03960 [Dehalococcoidales bacterium]|nr:hypothetical protein [Dehalococcoidales bacterium]
MSISGFMIGTATGLGILTYYLTMYLVSVLGMNTVGYWSFYFPIFGWLNWINILFASLGLILSFMGAIKGKKRLFGIAGIILCVCIILISVMDLPLPDVHWTHGATPDTGKGF